MARRIRVTVGIIVLNGAEHIARCLAQHYVVADRIVVVEGADRLYPGANEEGLSVDSTADVVRSFPDPQGKLTFVQHGWCRRLGPDAKCELRNRYMELCEPGLLAAIDCDELYRYDDFGSVVAISADHPWIQLPQVHFWKDTGHFITGGYFDVPHTRFWRVERGDRYVSNHNLVERLVHAPGLKLGRVVRDGRILGPCCYHLGFLGDQSAKNEYYSARGEDRTRPRTMESRRAWDAEVLPPYLTVHEYRGPYPEVLRLPYSDPPTPYRPPRPGS